jgi:hypothetical protein
LARQCGTTFTKNGRPVTRFDHMLSMYDFFTRSDADFATPTTGLESASSSPREHLPFRLIARCGCGDSGVADGFIKEVCFSGDGCILVSPFESGVRLHDCSMDHVTAVVSRRNELERQQCTATVDLPFFAELDGSVDGAVLTTRFLFVSLKVFIDLGVSVGRMAPHEPLLVTGHLGGYVRFYRPRLG